eukprot:scaffold36_cov102-Amphora_coffeaeformis.AAC.3
MAPVWEDGFKWGGGVVELDEGFDAVGVGSGKGSVEGVETTVEAGAGVEQDRQGRVRPSGTKGEVDGGQGFTDGDGNGWQAGGRDGREGMGERLDVEDELTVALGVWGWRRVGVAVVGWSGRSGSEGGAGSGWGWRVDDLLVGSALHRVSVVVESAEVGLVGKEFTEEGDLGGGVVLLRADGPGTVGGLGVLGATAEATKEGPGKATGVAGVGVGVSGEAVLGP